MVATNEKTMARANSNDTASFDSSRRRFISVAAAASDVAAGSLTVAATPPTEAIKAHADADMACNAAVHEIDRLLKAADDAGLPHEIQVLDHRKPPICLYVAASCVPEINDLLPGDEHQELRQFYYRKLDERSEERRAFWGFELDDLFSEPAAAERQALMHFAQMAPRHYGRVTCQTRLCGKARERS
jgi:hypothetical protein